jgi:toxin ParE1/3/4
MPASRKVEWTSAARDDLRSIYSYIAQLNPDFADAFILALYQKIETLARLGLTGTKTDHLRDDIRAFTFKERSFFIRVSDETITVLRVKHGRQDISPDDFPESDT